MGRTSFPGKPAPSGGVAALLALSATIGTPACASRAPPEDDQVASRSAALMGVAVFRSVEVEATSCPQQTPNASSSDSPPPDILASEDPPVAPPIPCEESLAPGLTRTVCPPKPLELDPCSVEGLECRYPHDQEYGATLAECIFGRWYLSIEGTELELAASSGEGECPMFEPIPDDRCDSEGLRCEYDRCPIFVEGWRAALCVCGRWRVGRDSCHYD